MNVVIGYETWIHFFEQHRKISNRAWLTKDARKPFIARRIASVKKVMYDIFSTTEGLAIKISVPKGKSMNARFYKKKFLESLSTSSRNVNQRHDLRHVFVTWERLESQGWKCDIVSKWTGGLHSRTPALFSRSCPLWLCTCSLISRKGLLAENKHPIKSWEQPYLTSLEIYLKRTMRKLSRIGLKDLDFMYLSNESTLKVWNKDFLNSTFLCHLPAEWHSW